MPGDIIPLNRVKLVERAGVDPRRLPVEKWPEKARELRAARPHGRIAGRELDVTSGLNAIKIAHRVRHAAKLRFFRSFKLLTPIKRTAGTELIRPPQETRFPKFVC
jgi:hypothetical protein